MEEGFEITRDEYSSTNIDEFIKEIVMKGLDPGKFQVEMYGSWVREEPYAKEITSSSAIDKDKMMLKASLEELNRIRISIDVLSGHIYEYLREK